MAKAITKEVFMERIQERYPNEQFEIVEYTTMSNPAQIKCSSCGKILQYPQAKNFLAKHKKAGCSECNGLRAKNKSNMELLQQQYEILNIERRASGALWYTCKCKNCGRISTHMMVSFLENSCRCQGKGNRWTEQELKEYLINEYGGEYTLISPFVNVNQKTLVKHSCGFVWPTTLAHLLYNKTGCPHCSHKRSKGCKVIEKALRKLNINFETERFLDNSLQRFDFYLEIANKKYAIEYNGEQHYKYNPFFHGHDINVFKKYQERDARKAEYCKKNNIELIIIPYTMSHEEIQAYINKLFSSSTTSQFDVAPSGAK